MQLGIERRMVPHIPWGLICSILAVSLLGLWNIAAATAVCVVDYRFIYRMAGPVYLINIGALLALKVLGHRAKGAESWFALGPLRLQPAEFMKIGLVLMLAKFFHDDYRPSDDSYGFSRLWKPVLISLVPMGLVLIQPDLGTTMMLLFTAATVILFGKVKRSVLVAVAIAGVLLSVVIWNDYVREPSESHRTFIRHLLKHHQSQRIASWLDPGRDLRGSNYHSAQSKIAVGSGGLTGKGWGHGTQTGLFFLPEQHTDFIFSVWAEEHGFLMCLVLIALYGCILLLAMGVAFNSRDRFGAFLAVGVAAMIF